MIFALLLWNFIIKICALFPRIFWDLKKKLVYFLGCTSAEVRLGPSSLEIIIFGMRKIRMFCWQLDQCVLKKPRDTFTRHTLEQTKKYSSERSEIVSPHVQSAVWSKTVVGCKCTQHNNIINRKLLNECVKYEGLKSSLLVCVLYIHVSTCCA